MNTASVSDLRKLATGLDHPEGIALAPNGLIWCGGEAGQIYRVDPSSGTVAEIANTGGFILGVCLDGDGYVYACSLAEEAIVTRIDPATGTVTPYCTSANGLPLETPNWAAFASDGTLWLTDSGTEVLDVCNGRLIQIPPGGGDGVVVPTPALHFPNGLCVNAEGQPFFVETLTPRLSTVLDGTVVVLADLPNHSPDGIALCADGSFLVACYYPFRILHVPREGGSFRVLLDDPTGIHMPMPTNVAFFGPNLDTLAIASLGGQVVNAIELGVLGAPLQYPTFAKQD